MRHSFSAPPRPTSRSPLIPLLQPPRPLSRASCRATLCLVFLIHGPLSALAAEPPPLREQLDRLLDDPHLKRATVGFRVVDLASGKVIYDHQGDRLLIPASNVKLVTTAAALARLGPDFQFRTLIGRRAADLVVVGGGDPTIGNRPTADGIPPEFRDWAKTLKSRGITRFTGDLVVDDSWFDDQFIHPNWPRPQLHLWYSAPVAALVLNDDCIQVVAKPGPKIGEPAQLSLLPRADRFELRSSVRTASSRSDHLWSVYRSPGSTTILARGSFWARANPAAAAVTVDDPPLYFGSVLHAALRDEGIEIRGSVRRERGAGRDKAFRTILTHATPLVPVLETTNKQSHNLYAEQLFKTLGAVEGSGTWPGGRRVIEGFLNRVALPPKSYVLDDGSGLSKENRFSATQLASLLRWMFLRPDGETFRRTLSVGGIDGTLKRRLTTPDLRGQVFAKTGSLSGARALSGYVQTDDGRWLAFSFLVNDCKGSVKEVQDRLCRILLEAPR